MTPIKMIFQSGSQLIVYSDDPNSFSDSILAAKPPEIAHIEYSDVDHLRDHPELQEVKLTLQSGAIVLCSIARGDIPKADYIEEVVECNTSNTITYTNMARLEAELDVRFAATSAVINNLPDLDTRLYLHTEYLRRKQAYVSAVEALVDGVIRRHND